MVWRFFFFVKFLNASVHYFNAFSFAVFNRFALLPMNESTLDVVLRMYRDKLMFINIHISNKYTIRNLTEIGS